jgi:hypothetical protein
MGEVKLVLNDKGEGAFYLIDGEEQLGEMVVSIDGSNMTVHHTEVAAKSRRQGLS